MPNRLKLRLLTLIAVFVGLLAMNVVFVLHFVAISESDGQMINISGRQRMLTQQMARGAHEWALGHAEATAALGKAIDLFNNQLDKLRQDGDSRGGDAEALRSAQGEVLSAWSPFEKKLRAALAHGAASPGAVAAAEALGADADELHRRCDALVSLYQAGLDDEVARLETRAWLLAALGAVMALIGLLFLWSHLCVPLAKLADAARVVGEGDLSHRVDIQSTDEIGMVAKEFNLMVTNVEGTNHDLAVRADAQQQQYAQILEMSVRLETVADGVVHAMLCGTFDEYREKALMAQALPMVEAGGGRAFILNLTSIEELEENALVRLNVAVTALTNAGARVVVVGLPAGIGDESALSFVETRHLLAGGLQWAQAATG